MITKSQTINLENGFVQSVGQTGFQKLDLSILDKLLKDTAEKFKDNLIANIQRKQITGSGEMEKNITFTLTEESSGIKVLEIYLVDYAKFVDKGVKGWGSTRNAPSSPYQFKTKGMSQEGRNSIKRMIESGKYKTLSVRNTKSVGYEKKNKSLIDQRVDSVVYLIKKYGIKTRSFITDAVEKTFKDFQTKIADEFAVNIAVQITK